MAYIPRPSAWITTVKSRTPNRRKPRVLAHTHPSQLALGWLPMLQRPKPQYRARANGL
ncbi:hypothetical protein BDR03DRAFT_962764 [Suillus americanus]|nr:hypothetical protein BDR03DRAFT_962764 [Suillus americanus]